MTNGPLLGLNDVVLFKEVVQPSGSHFFRGPFDIRTFGSVLASITLS